ncbi:MAG: hypothetical protein KDD58_10450 [Bdellovibrionales bacterium]|nr:hypothetical protein [Bdellovibrionales bacterium]
MSDSNLILKRARKFNLLALCLWSVLVSACATYQAEVHKSRQFLRENPAKAAELLKEKALAEGKDQLVYLLDYATALQTAKLYEESNKYYLIADRMAEVKDYHSISKQLTSIVVNEEMVQYKGDDYEKVLINAMLAINFLCLGDLDGALVETRRLIEKLEHYRVDGKKPYEQNHFATYLGALIWESDRKWDDAYISFEKTYKLNPDIPYLKEDLIRAALRAQRGDTAKKWEKEFGIKRKKQWFNKNQGELVLIHLQGWGPRKRPNPKWHRIPTLRGVPSYTKAAQLEVVGVGKEDTQKIYNLEKVAIKTLDDQYAPLIAKRIAAVAAKEVLADQVRQKNEALGALLGFAMHAVDRADLRQWSTLPESFGIAKMRLKPGKYKIRARGLNAAGEPNDEVSPEMEVVVRKGKKTFVSFRTFQ